MPIPPNEIHFIIGKGGTGKTTISVLLAEYFASQNEPVIIVECNGARDIPQRYQKSSLGYQIQALTPLISSLSVTAEEAIEDYLLQQLHFQKLYRLMFKNRFIEPLLQGAPGLHDAVHLGKIYDIAIMKQGLAPRFKHIIVDCPATGHGLRLLTAARTMMDLAKIGPLYESNRQVEELIQARSDLSIITLPEELPCLESKQLWNQLDVQWQQKTKLLFINKYKPDQLAGVSLSDRQQQDFPQHYRLLERYKQEQCERENWQQWLRRELPIKHIDIPLQTPSTLSLGDAFERQWRSQ